MLKVVQSCSNMSMDDVRLSEKDRLHRETYSRFKEAMAVLRGQIGESIGRR